MSTVTQYLHRHGLGFEEVHHPRAFRASDEATVVGVSPSDVVKTVVLDVRGGHALAVIPGSRRLDMRLVRNATGDPHAHLASEGEIAHDFPDYQLGTIPPLGRLLSVPMYVDTEVLSNSKVVFAAGDQTESIRVSTDELVRTEPATVTHLTRLEETQGEA